MEPDNNVDMQYYPLLQPSDKEVFLQDMKALESVVKDSLLVYTAYELKSQDAIKYLEDPKQDFPFLKREAELRKVSVEDLCKMVIEKAKLFKDAIRNADLLRNEFNLLYPTLDTYESTVKLRDRLLGEFRKLTEDIL